MTEPTFNPVERRLLYLCEHWASFREQTDKRLLLWQVQDNANRIAHAFFEVQKHETPYTTGDTFVVFDAPFEHSLQYSKAIKEALAGHHEASREDLAAQGLDAEWEFYPDEFPDTAAGVLGVLCRFGSHYREALGHLVAVFAPTDVEDADKLAAWLTRLLDGGLPERLRIAIVDSLEHPRFRAFAAKADPRVVVQQPRIDGLTVAQETFAQEKTVGPAGVYRNLMMGVMSLVERGSANDVMAKATDACAFAQRQSWPDQEVVLRTLVASALLKESRHEEAARVYQAARDAATKALAADHPAGPKLVMQTWFGEAGAHLAGNAPQRAAECYDAAVALANRQDDTLMAIEGLRMSAFCLARHGELTPATTRLNYALDLGNRLKPESREMTTLPVAAIDLLRVLDGARVVKMEHIRFALDTRLKKAGDTIDAQSQDADPDTAELEAAHAAELDAASLAAEAELQQLVASADEAFQEAFDSARSLLGDAWPMHNPVALPATPPPEARAAV